MAYSSPCLVWDQPTEVGGLTEYPQTLAEVLDAPVYTWCLSEPAEYDIRAFGDDTFVDSLALRTPLAEKYKTIQYANWKTPPDHDCLITRGPKTIHTVQRLNQDHIHIVDGSYRGLFLHRDQYGLIQEKGDIAQFFLGWNRLLMRTIVQGSMHTVDTLVVNSEWTADIVEGLYDRQADAIIYPPTDISDVSPADTADGSYYLYLGSIDPLHRTREVIEAFELLPYELVVAGRGSWLDEAKARAGENIAFRGYVRGEEKRRLLADCKALVVPARHSFGRVFVEALAAGRPVVAAAHGYAPYIIDDGATGLLYDPGTDNLVDAIERCEDATWETDRLTERAADYSLEEVKRRWRTLIHE